MPEKPRTKKSKATKVAKVLREQKAGELRTSAGKVPSKKQALAIALSEAGVAKVKDGSSRTQGPREFRPLRR